jgi:hypothetical protein
MDDMTRFERRLTDELDDMAGPGRDIDAMAMTRAVGAQPRRRRSGSMFSATRLVLAGGLAVLVAIVLVIGGTPPQPQQELIHAGASASPSAPASVAPSPSTTVLPGLVTEEVEPGVLRIVRDDAGHDLDAGHPNFRYDLDGMTITPDGTVWLQATYHDSDNGVGVPRDPLVWALGRPGVLGVADGIPPSVQTLVPLLDGSVLAVGDEVVRVDRASVTPDDGPTVREVYGGSLWLIGPEALAGFSGGEAPERRLALIWSGREWRSLSDIQRTADACQATYDGVVCPEHNYLEGTNINEVVRAPDGTLWAVGGFEDEGGGLYHITQP